MDDVNSPQKIIQMQFPITWLIGMGIAVGGAFLGSYIQLNNATNGISDLKGTVQEMRKAQEVRDDRMSLISTSNLEVRSQMNDLQRQMTRVSEDVSDLRKQEQFRQNEKRWAPK